MRTFRLALAVTIVVGVASPLAWAVASPQQDQNETTPVREYQLLATSKTSTMEKELNEAADAGFRFADVMGGETSFGGNAVVVVMERLDGGEPLRYQYKLLATPKTSTMQKELQEAGDAGFAGVGQTIFSSTFGGQEVMLILEHDREFEPPMYEYRLLATKKTSTLSKELQEAARSTWRVSTRSNALDDSTMYMAILDASTGVGGLLDNEKVRLFAENGMSSGIIVDGMPEFPDKVVGPAWAQEGSGFYLSSEQGASFASGLDFSGTSDDRESACDEFLNPWYLLGGDRCTKVNRGEGDDWKNVFDGARGIVSGVALGYRLEGRFRLESEYFFYNSEYDQTTPVTGAEGVGFAKLGQEIERAEDRLGNLSSHNLFGNLYFDFINSSRFTPYVGVGAGVGFAAVDWGSIWARNADPGKITTGADFPFASNAQLVAFRQNLAGTVSSARSELSDTLFGYQVLLGADYALTERVSLGVKGRWVNYSSLSDDVVWDPLRSHEPNLRRDGSEPVKGRMTSRNVAMVDFSFDLKYAF